MNPLERSGEQSPTSELFQGKQTTVLDDPVLLRVAIRYGRELGKGGRRFLSPRRCRLDCAEAERRIRKLKDDHQDYVPKEDFDQLQYTHAELVKANDQLKQNFRNAKVEYK